VHWVENEKGKFDVKVKNRPKNFTYTEIFDHIIGHSRHFSTSNRPHFDEFENFKG
jgi:hypothetical protein